MDVGGVISVLRCAGFRVDDGILGVDEECTAAIGFEEEPVADDEVRWLYRELPELVRRGIVPPPVAARLRDHYGAPAPVTRPPTRVLAVFGVLGATLVGLGVILLLAHNWDGLTRAARTALVFGLLLGAQALGGFALLSRRGSVAWTESTSGFLALSVGAALALISQTYQLPGEPREMILIWMLLIAPLPYVFGAALPAIGYWIGITAWALIDPHAPASLAIWSLLAGIGIADLLRASRWRVPSARSALHAWAVAVCLPPGLLALLAFGGGTVWALLAPALGAAMVAAGRIADERDLSQLGLPFRLLGTLGLGALVVVLSFGIWDKLPLWPTAPGEIWRAWIALGLAVLLAAFVVPWAWRELTAKRWHRAWLLAAPAPFGLALLAADLGDGVVSALLVNAYGLGLGLTAILAGLRAGRISTTNAGMLLLAALIAARFVDSEWSFLARGLVFIGLGGAFLGLNLRLRGRFHREDA